MRVKLTVNGTELTGTLGEGAAARDFAALLPPTVELSGFQVASGSPSCPGH